MPLQFQENGVYIIGARRIDIDQLKAKTFESADLVTIINQGTFWLELNFSKEPPSKDWSIAIQAEFGWLLLGISYKQK
jgi:hypothetical protein